MAVVARNIEGQFYPYHAFNFPLSPLPTSNSSSVIASLLYYIGVDIAKNMPSTFFTFTTGTRTLFGTSEDDDLQVEWSFNTIMSGDGNDVLQGTDDTGLIEKLYGGRDDDTFVWSNGLNIFHGGQPGLTYGDDGIDLVDYTGIGRVHLEITTAPVPHLLPDFVANHAGGTDYLFSIEKVRWTKDSDVITVGEGLELLEDKQLFDLDDQTPGDRGDVLDFQNQNFGILVAPSDRPGVSLAGLAGLDPTTYQNDAGLWLRSVEWLIGSNQDDRIYGGDGMVGLAGGAGDDTLSGFGITAFTGLSPEGYDIEITGDDGDDIIISGSGRTLATGGEGDDIFVLSALTTSDTIVEFVIADASTSDRLFVPYNFLKNDTGDFEGSELFPILGGMSPLDGLSSFEDLPQHIGDDPGGVTSQQGFFYLIWQTIDDQIFIPDASQGLVDIAGQVFFDRDGSDLLIHVFAGEAYEETLFNSEDEPYDFTSISFFPESETVIRVKDFSEGMLGIQFFDLGAPVFEDHINYQGRVSISRYANWDTAANYLTNGGTLTEALEAAPATPIFDLPEDGEADQREQIIGTENADTLFAGQISLFAVIGAPTPFSSGYDLHGEGGDDTLTGSAKSDLLDGGSGNDVMTGGAGNDTYIVGQAGDLVIEAFNQGTDRVVSSINYTLGDHVEHLDLSGTAVVGTGNALANRITGNAGDNIIHGEAGNDILYGAGGADVLDGGEGSDSFVYALGEGNQTIRDTGATTDTDRLRVVNATASDIQIFISAANANDVILRFSDGGRVLLEGFLNGDNIEAIELDDGTLWSREDIQAAANAAEVLLNDAPVAVADRDYYSHLTDVVIGAAELLANDSDWDGDTLSLISVATSTPGASASLTANGDVRLVIASGFTGLVAFSYTISDGQGGTATGEADITFFGNAAPLLTGTPLQNVSLDAGEAWSFAVPLDTFSDADGHSMVYTARLAGGAALPDWLSYDPDTRTFSGIAPVGFEGSLDVELTASDGVAQTSTVFQVLGPGGSGGPGIIFGTPRNDVLYGTPGNDTFDALARHDTQFGYGGDDIFFARGNAGFDIYVGGAGTDIIQGSDGNDIIGLKRSPLSISGIEEIDGGGGFDILRLSTGPDRLDLRTVTVTSIERIEGGSGNDVIFGSEGRDVIAGGRNNDRMYGGGGNDIFLIGTASGSDFFNGGDGFDTILGTSQNNVLFVSRGRADLVSIERIDLGAGTDTIQLGGGNDVLNLSSIDVRGVEKIHAGAGNDRITGSSGSDTIWGGGGRDTFVFAGNFGHDTIADFDLGPTRRSVIDRIDFSGTGIDSIGELLANTQMSGGSAVITDPDSGSTVRLAGIHQWQLSGSDFIF